MLRFAIIVSLAIATPGLASSLTTAADPAAQQASAPVPPTATFVAPVAFGCKFEIESSKLAIDRSQAEAVKAFAQRLLDDHLAAAVRFKEAVLAADAPGVPELGGPWIAGAMLRRTLL